MFAYPNVHYMHDGAYDYAHERVSVRKVRVRADSTRSETAKRETLNRRAQREHKRSVAT